MVNFNGKLLADGTAFLAESNRALKYGDAIFETIRVVNKKIIFWEDHYLRLMASMRILRMDIPMNFTMEFLEESILTTINANGLALKTVRIRFTVFRNGGGLYTPENHDISYIIEAAPMSNPFYKLSSEPYEVELFKDHWVNTGLLSTLKSANKLINVLAGIFADENGYDNCLLLNHEKNVVEALNGNLFVVSGSTVKTPPLTDGCLNGVLRKQLIKMINKNPDLHFEESSVSPFELQKADELFITNVISGIQPVTKYRKKSFGNLISTKLVQDLNVFIRIS
ncbi:aminotransferase class IV [Ascidiimonas sp. W6]|uniref:aminotransferase class IV n=1 Tax=Ascidiimonas meishanensis TaxID=3128903 RepID=UPI0030ECB269